MADPDLVLGDPVQDPVAADAKPAQPAGAEGERVSRIGIVGQSVDRLEDRADAVRVVVQKDRRLADRLVLEGDLAAHSARPSRRLTSASGV